MNNKFDELTKNLAQSVTRRGALKKFGVGLAGMALACFALANNTSADPKSSACSCASDSDCNGGSYCSGGVCLPKWCDASVNFCCCYVKGNRWVTARPTCDPSWGYCTGMCGFGLGG